MQHSKYRFKLKTETILYTVIKYCDQKLYGLPDILSGRSISELPAIESYALDDLMENECASMDFNGKIALSQEYLDCINECAKCRDIAGVDIRRPDGSQRHMTIYYMGEGKDCIVIKSVDGVFAGVCGLFQGSVEELVNQIDDAIDMDMTKPLMPNEYRLESIVVQRGNVDEMRGYGCDKSAANLISGMVKGERTALIAKKLHGDEEAGFFSAIWGDEGSMEMKVEYEEWKENIIFKPVTKEEITSNVKRIIET